jgi:hypothetical protein
MTSRSFQCETLLGVGKKGYVWEKNVRNVFFHKEGEVTEQRKLHGEDAKFYFSSYIFHMIKLRT